MLGASLSARSPAGMFSGNDAERGKLAETWALASMLQSGQGCRSLGEEGNTGIGSRPPAVSGFSDAAARTLPGKGLGKVTPSP